MSGTLISQLISCLLLTEESEQDTCGDGRSDHTGNVRAHGVHQQVVGLVVLQTYQLGHTGGVRYSGYSGVSDKRVDLVSGLEEEVEDLHEHHTAEGSYHEGECSEDEDVYGLQLQELVGLGGASYGQTDEDGHDVDQRSACGLVLRSDR